MKLPKIITWILVILAPLGILYLLLHTMSRDFRCFCTVLIVFGAGIILGIYLTGPETFFEWLGILKNLGK